MHSIRGMKNQRRGSRGANVGDRKREKKERQSAWAGMSFGKFRKKRDKISSGGKTGELTPNQGENFQNQRKEKWGSKGGEDGGTAT